MQEFALGIQMFSGGAKSIDVARLGHWGSASPIGSSALLLARLMFEVTVIKKYMTDMYDATLLHQ